MVLISLQREKMKWKGWHIIICLLFIPCPVPKRDVRKQDGWSSTSLEH